MGKPVPEVDRELEARVEDLGYELVASEWGGSKSRPLLRLRIDVQGAAPGEGVTVDDCSRVSRALEAWLDSVAGLGERYVLEVSSPGLDRPLVRDRDFDRFRGEWIAVKGRTVLAERARRLEGELLGMDAEHRAVRLKLQDGTDVSIPLEEITGAHLVFRWD
jgi:ribosome maturation factor RimP